MTGGKELCGVRLHACEKRPYERVQAHKDFDYRRYRVILKKVLFGIFRVILVSKEEKNFTIESKDKGLSLGKFL